MLMRVSMDLPSESVRLSTTNIIQTLPKLRTMSVKTETMNRAATRIVPAWTITLNMDTEMSFTILRWSLTKTGVVTMIRRSTRTNPVRRIAEVETAVSLSLLR